MTEKDTLKKTGAKKNILYCILLYSTIGLLAFCTITALVALTLPENPLGGSLLHYYLFLIAMVFIFILFSIEGRSPGQDTVMPGQKPASRGAETTGGGKTMPSGNKTKSGLRALLDLTENAGFIVTDYREQGSGISITIQHSEKKTAGEIVALFENNAYRILEFLADERSREATHIKIALEHNFTVPD
jgi:hypothetical protein